MYFIKGCLVHFKRCQWRKLQALNLTTLFCKIQDFEILVKSIYALAYCPPDEVSAYYQEGVLDVLLVKACKTIDEYQPKANAKDLKGKPWEMTDEDKEALKESINDYLNYIEKTFVGAKSRTGTTKPRFSPNIWSVHDAALHMEPTDTNRNEGLNSVLRGTVSHNAGVWQLLEALIGMEAKTRVKRDEDMARLPVGGTQVNPLTGDLVGPATARERRHSVMAWEKANIIEHRSNYDKAEYLRRLCTLKDRRQPKPDESSESDVSDDGDAGPSQPRAAPSQGYMFQRTNYLK